MRILQTTLIACLLTLATALPAGAQAKTLCDLPKNKIMADLQTRLEDRYPTSDTIRIAQFSAAERDLDALCRNPLSPRGREVLADLTTRHYPSVTLIRSFYESLMGATVAN